MRIFGLVCALIALSAGCFALGMAVCNLIWLKGKRE